MSELGAIRLAAILAYAQMRKRCSDVREEAIARVGEENLNAARLNRIRNRSFHVGYERWKRRKDKHGH